VALTEWRARIDRRASQESLEYFPPALNPERLRHPAVFAAHSGFVRGELIRRAAENRQVHIEKQGAIAPGHVVEAFRNDVAGGSPNHASDVVDAFGPPCTRKP